MLTGGHSIVYSTNADADRAFFRDVLKLPNVDAGDGWLIFALPPSEVAVHPSEKNDIHALYLMCDDIDAFIKDMLAHNVACGAVQDRGWGRLAQLTLPGGGTLGVYQPRHVRPPAPRASQDVVPMLAYADGPAAMDWLARAFGFRECTRMIGTNGQLSHGEMDTGGGIIMMATPTPDYQGPRAHRASCERAARWSEVPWVIDGVLVQVDDVDAHYARAKREGARILSDPEGGFPARRYRAEDLEGHRWMFVQRSPH
jgi:PhnB protein